MFSTEALHLESFLKWSSVMSSAWETASANSSKEVRLSPVHTDLVMEYWVLRVDTVPGTVDNPAVWALVGQAGHYNNEFLVSSAALACFLVADGIVISKEVSEFQWLVRQQFAFGKNPVSSDRALRQRRAGTCWHPLQSQVAFLQAPALSQVFFFFFKYKVVEVLYVVWILTLYWMYDQQMSSPIQ